eukprot:5924328-Lingulodinium_polyedra.AAC.1
MWTGPLGAGDGRGRFDLFLAEKAPGRASTRCMMEVHVGPVERGHGERLGGFCKRPDSHAGRIVHG